MYIKNDLVDSRMLEEEKIVNPGYLSSFIRELRKIHETLIEQCFCEPEFFVDGLAIYKDLHKKI